ncbi:MAG TPA: 3-keto-5-aminohexanoate cleavage protein [Conexibacter sp.]|nr:3-keto-5-aminohexanoate cleavage protein [Conexibacter sp.]
MPSEKPCIITAALTGVLTRRSHNPALPCTPAEIVAAAIEARQEGAAIVHIHVRTPDGEPTHDVELYREIQAGLADQDLILNFTTSYIPDGSMSEEQRFEPVSLRPELATFNSGSLNFGDMLIYENSPAFMVRMAEAMREHGVRPEFEVFDTGQIGNIARMIEAGHFEPPYYFQFVTGPKGAMPSDPRLLQLAIELLPPQSEWVALGVGAGQLLMSTLGILLGGHVRVGFEDNVYYRRGELATSNAQLVARAARLARELEREVATPQQARELLGLAQRP